jgi:hypothetical protein
LGEVAWLARGALPAAGTAAMKGSDTSLARRATAPGFCRARSSQFFDSAAIWAAALVYLLVPAAEALAQAPLLPGSERLCVAVSGEFTLIPKII